MNGITRSPARLLLLKQAPTGFPPQQKVKKTIFKIFTIDAECKLMGLVEG